MSLDSHSLERLRELGRKLPESLPNPKRDSGSDKESKQRLHPIETEQNPNKLFQELIKASTDGKVPPHLIERLKKTESNQLANLTLDNEKHIPKHKKNSDYNSQKVLNSIKQKDDLYIAFKQLLLEEDNDN